ncbi:hypothetical protein KUW14_13505 [Pseudooceanicola nitratireducens]|uniref:hypothetical protein n=1 Tax=Pseudooceanicola nitratireducens TaxID=517719 RepID=UPI001C963D75|nr:hypothetical protein [Pseudooceanicola nitratireducens]MBY6166865.1 hypothetical protein [Pseudooceanicola nitratireducens]
MAVAEGIANIRQQNSDLQSVRGQASFAATVASVIAAFFGALISVDLLREEVAKNSAVLIFLGLSLLVLSLVFAMQVSVGARDVDVFVNPEAISYFAANEDFSGEGYRYLAKNFHSCFEQNEKVISDARANLHLALLFGILQIIPWSVLIALVVMNE